MSRRNLAFAGLVASAMLSACDTAQTTGPATPAIVVRGQTTPLAQLGNSPLEALVISTDKPLGPALGTFTTTGAFVESGTLVTLQRIVSALPSPFGVVSHFVLLFEGGQGTFTIRAQIIERDAGDENIFTNEGTWVIVDGTGAYSELRGSGSMEGIVDHDVNNINRVYTGLVH
jgi:hypothetical protein